MATPRLRFAPSPTGYLHVGGARTALFNWLYARKHGGVMLLRIEDTDKARSTDESTRAIFEGLNWLGLQWDEDVVHQGANLDRHRADAERMLANDTAYRCFCTQEELAERRAAAEANKDSFKYDRRCDRLSAADIAARLADNMPFTVRFRVSEGHTSWNDLVHDTISFPNKDIEDFIILRTDGTPIYNMAVVSDDIAMGITLVMRGDDHISNTPKQILLYRALGAELPQFAHLPMIHGLDGKKLSKRHGATAVGDYQHLGILPGAMLNFLALLGWAPGDDIELMTRDEMIALFDTKGLQKKAAIFDTKKLEWMNGQHLNLLPIDELMSRVTPALVASGHVSAEWLAGHSEWYLKLLELLKVRARTVDDIVQQAGPYLTESVVYDPDAVARQWKDRAFTETALAGVHEALSALPGWNATAMEEALRAVAERLGLGDKAGKIFQPLRVALTGSSASPGIFDVLELLGRERSLARLSSALHFIANTTT
ncbi:MAG: glutamyl-tRNA synthetase [Gemmatimonadetes bacterium]|nr:glutamyl-tRNA synthetase [Gemmatimonadota bacterium]